MNKKKRLHQVTMTFIALFFSLSVRAQQAINGTLRSSSGEPVSAATITVKGTNKSVISDDNGKFSINAPIGGTLIISSVGFQNREIAVISADINETLQVADPT